MKYKVTLNGRTYEVEVDAGKAMLTDEYEAYAPAPAAPAPWFARWMNSASETAPTLVLALRNAPKTFRSAISPV